MCAVASGPTRGLCRIVGCRLAGICANQHRAIPLKAQVALLFGSSLLIAVVGSRATANRTQCKIGWNSKRSSWPRAKGRE